MPFRSGHVGPRHVPPQPEATNIGFNPVGERSRTSAFSSSRTAVARCPVLTQLYRNTVIRDASRMLPVGCSDTWCNAGSACPFRRRFLVKRLADSVLHVLDRQVERASLRTQTNRNRSRLDAGDTII